MNFSDVYKNTNLDPGFNIDLEFDLDKAPAYDWSADTKTPEKGFLDRFTDELQGKGYFDQSKEETKKRDVYGDRRRSAGDTVADLGGGNTAVNPNTSSLIQSQMAMMNKGPGLGGQIAGAGAAAGVSMIPGVGPALAPFAGNFVSGLFG